MKKTRKTYIIFTLGFLLLFASCSRDYPLHEKAGDIRFPLSVGNWWQYERVWTYEGVYNPWSDDTLRSSIYWEIIDRDILGSQKYDTYVLQSKEYPVIRYRRSPTLNWYSEDWEGELGLFHVAYYWEDAIPSPKLPHPYKIRFMGKEFDSPNEVFGVGYVKGDTIRISPQKVLVYPLQVGKEWVAFDDGWLLQKRRVVDMETISTPAGDFLCYKIQVYYNAWNEDILWYDWFADEGLIKRYHWWKGEVVDECGNTIGYFEERDIQLLESYFVKH